MERVSIAEAAERLGVSEITIRRRIKRDELAAEKEEIPSGFTYQVLLPPIEEMERGAQQHQHTDTTVLEAAISTRREELERRSEENRRPQELLAREQALVQSLIERVPALPEGPRTQEDTQRVANSAPVQTWWSGLRRRLARG